MTPSPNPAPEPAPEKSATVKRYRPHCGCGYGSMTKSADGAFVLIDDYAKLEADLAQARAELAEAKKWLEGVHDVQDAPAADVACRIQFCDDEPIDCGEGFIDVKCWELAPDQSGTRYADLKKATQARDTIKALREALENPDWTDLWKQLNYFASGESQNQFARVEPLAVLGDLYQRLAIIHLANQAALASTQEDAP